MNGPSSVAAEYAVVAKTHVLQAGGDSPWSKCTSAWTCTVGSSKRAPSGRMVPATGRTDSFGPTADCKRFGGAVPRPRPWPWKRVARRGNSSIQLQDAVSRVVVVDAFRTRLKAGFAAKTDRLDARRLADALRRESVVGIYVPATGDPRMA